MDGFAESSDTSTRITVNPGRRSGQPCIRNYRISVKDVLEYLAGGMTPEEILVEFPELEYEDLRAVYAFAAQQVSRAA